MCCVWLLVNICVHVLRGKKKLTGNILKKLMEKFMCVYYCMEKQNRVGRSKHVFMINFAWLKREFPRKSQKILKKHKVRQQKVGMVGQYSIHIILPLVQEVLKSNYC